MSFKDTVDFNSVHDMNVNKCLQILNEFDFKDLHLSDEIEKFICDISSNHQCNEKVLFYTILSGMSHFAESMKIYTMRGKQVKPVSVYHALIAPSGLYKKTTVITIMLIICFHFRCREVKIYQHNIEVL